MLGKAHKAYFRAAQAMSKLSDYPCQIGCVIVKGHRIISSGHNSHTRCNKLQAQLDTQTHGIRCPGKLHAELMALLPLMKAKVDLRHASIYIYRQHKNGTLAMSRPCASCEKIIRKLNIKKIFYTIESGYATERW